MKRRHDVAREGDFIMTRKPGQPARWAGMALGMIVASWVGGAAAAMRSCQGTYAATLLQPLPERIVAGLDIHDLSPGNQKLAERFLKGLHDAGVATGPQPTVLLHVSSSVLDDTQTPRDTGREQSYRGLSALEGGIRHPLPRASDTRTQTSRPVLFLRVDATEGQAMRISWVASVQCRRTGTDDGDLAEDLGHLIGGALGQRIPRGPL